MAHRDNSTVPFLVVLGFLSVAFAPFSGRAQESPAAWQATAYGLASLQLNLEPGWGFDRLEVEKPGSGWDVNRYFAVLDRLSVEQGFILDWVYCFDGTGGSPKLYARPEGQPPLTSCSEVQNPDEYLDHIKTDGSKEGFFQLVLLKVVAEQFFLTFPILPGK